MSLAQNYRIEAARYAELVAVTRSLKDGGRYRKLATSYAALADNEEWLAGDNKRGGVTGNAMTIVLRPDVLGAI